jgi:outer membrane protein assembly factor BamB
MNPGHTSAGTDSTLKPPLARRWMVPLGAIASYPLVVNGFVYVATRGSPFGSPGLLYALDVGTGATAWRVDLGSVGAANLAFDQGRVFVFDGRFRAFDASSGTLLWTTAPPGFYDVGAPPVAYRGIVYLSAEVVDATVFAFDEASGALLWTKPTHGTGGPFAVSDDGVFIADGCENDLALDRISGAPLWSTKGSCDGGVTDTPVVFGRTMYARDPMGNIELDALSGSVIKTFTADVAPALAQGGFYVSAGTLYAADVWLGTTAWTFKADADIGTTPLVIGPYVYVGSKIGTVFALDAASGAVLWSENTGVPLISQEPHGGSSITQEVAEPPFALAGASGILVVPAGPRLFAYSSASAADAGARDAGTDGGCAWTLKSNGSPLKTDSGPTHVAISDLNGDGKPDLVTSNGSASNLSVILGNGDGTFRAQATYAVSAGAYAIAMGDLNGDGKLDVAVAGASGGGGTTPPTISVLLGNGDGTLRMPSAFATAPAPADLAIGDLNADGKLDIAVEAGQLSGVSILLGRGDGTFQPQVTYASGGTGGMGLAMGDLNGDGKLDLVVANRNSKDVDVFLGRGDGTFPAATAYPVGANAESVAIADINKDHVADLAVTNTDGVTVFLGKGDGTFRGLPTYLAGVNPSSVAIGDLNGDGSLDLAIANEGTNSLSVLLGNGDGTFQWQVVFATEQAPTSAVLGDLNGDGRLDVAVANSGSDSVTVFLGTCQP